MKKYVAAVIAVLILAGGIFWYRQRAEKREDARITATSIFSWEGEYMEAGLEDKVKGVMEALSCGAIYQSIPEDIAKKTVVDYLKRRYEAGQDVYYLTGKKEWALAKELDHMLVQVEVVKEWNAKIGAGKGFRGIVLDVEPYLMDGWEEDREAYMEQYVDNMTAAYEAAHKEGLRVIVCIPNFYDRMKLEKQLERLVDKACDGIAVMNYNKNDEAGQILTEVTLAEKYQKAVLNIVELQKPGYHELTEDNTYYNDGIQAVYDSWEHIRASYPYEGLGFSWHYLKPAIELMAEGETP